MKPQTSTQRLRTIAVRAQGVASLFPTTTYHFEISVNVVMFGLVCTDQVRVRPNPN